jgi:hypothetical protein
MGLVTPVSEPGAALTEARRLAHELAALPQACLRSDRASVYEQAGLSFEDAIAAEWRHGAAALQAEAANGARRFAEGAGRHGS